MKCNKISMLQEKSKGFLLACFFLVTTFWTTNLLAAETITLKAQAMLKDSTITLTNGKSLNFGDIAVVPNTAASILIDAKAGAATATTQSGTATLSGQSHSGVVKVLSPVTTNLSINYAIQDADGINDKLKSTGAGNKKLTLTAANIATYSTPTGLAVTGGVEATINVGGLLEIPVGLGDADFAQTYEGTVTITVDYN
ncbi:MAG: hypothetical protein CSA21_02340 [Deltaproteobacteria bacterium]|nr:MAG: hypothetical protein CSA21_02340 [Deltaproteobacteria bacterium]